MDNRERDKLSRSDHSTEAGDINRETSARKGRQNDSSADFGQSIGRSESPRGNVPGRDSGSEGYGSSSGRSGSAGSMGRNRQMDDLEVNRSDRDREDSLDRSDRSVDRSEGRH